MTDSLQNRWDKLLVTFFGSANLIDWPPANEKVSSFVKANEQSLTRESVGPFVLPCLRFDKSTEYFAIAIDDSQSRELRQLVASLSGATYTTYDGRAVSQEDGDPVAQAAIKFAGSAGRVFQFSVVGDAQSKIEVREQMLRLLELSRRRPRRVTVATKPIGRLLRDFDRALGNLDENTARELLYGQIAASGLLSAMNRLFLESRFLVTFEHWEEFEALPSFDDLLRTSRPALVSDALAQLACFQLSEGENGMPLVERFSEVIAPRFGDLIPSVGRIRSELGAQYYVLFHLIAGDSSEDLESRLFGTRWGEVALVQEIFASHAVELTQVPTAVGTAAIAAAMELGRCEHAIDLMAADQPSADLLPFMVEAVRRTLSIEAMNLLVRFRESLGDLLVDLEISRQEKNKPVVDVQDGVTSDWAERIRLVAEGQLRTASFERMVEEEGLLEFARDSSQVERVALQVEASTNRGGPERVLTGSIALLRRIGQLLPDSESGRLARLRFAILYLWNIGDDSGDHGIASDILDEVECLIGAGVTTDQYQEALELLATRWDSFRTDVAFGLGVRAVEILAAGQPDGFHQLSAFASPIFARITDANIDRIDSIDLAVAQRLSAELNLGIRLEIRSKPEQVDGEVLLAKWRGHIGIYSLDEPALRRASQIISDKFPGAEITTSSEKVGSERLSALARRADVMIVATQHAKHQAFHAIQAARPNRSLTYPIGKGSSSLIRAAIDGVAALTA